MEPQSSSSSDADLNGAEPELVPDAVSAASTEAEPWRDELSARLNRYRSRRKAPPPRYPSLRLPFNSSDPARVDAARVDPARAAAPEHMPFPSFDSVSNQALALDEMRAQPESAPEPSALANDFRRETAGNASHSHSTAHATPHSTAQPTAKIIEFPRFNWGPPPAPPDQLAEPVSDRPRILEVPESELPPPALGGITIEPIARLEPQKRPGIDIPLQPAPLGRRLVAATVDGAIILIASALFGFVFWKIAAVRPPRIQLFSLATTIPCLFWAAYQYLLIVYSGRTPGLRAAGLSLVRFDGTNATRALRRWRVLASWLSALSLGMGYVWVFLDEDSLCWHDRTTHTFLSPSKSIGQERQDAHQRIAL